MTLRRVLLTLLVGLLLLPAVLVTLARVVEPPSLLFVRLDACSPYATVLYLLALVVLVPTALRARGSGRTATAGLAVVALLGVGLHAYWSRGPYVGAGGSRSTTAGSVRVMTTNMFYGGASARRVVRLAEQNDVALLVLEEVTPEALAGLRRAGVDRLLGHRAGSTRPGTRRTLVFSTSPMGRMRWLEPGFGNGVLDVRLAGLGRVHLVAAHPRPPKNDVDQWLEGQELVREAAQALSGPTLVVGDLNATMDHASLRALAADGFQDAVTQARSGWQPTWPSAGQVSVLGVGPPPLFAIDHVLTRSGPRAVRTRTYDVPGTDHRALVVTLVP
jgi:endonuclease/exonuclease/phosphatase (EEP) superfamily protein YafD